MLVESQKWLKTGEDYISDPADFDKKKYTLGSLLKEELEKKYTDTVGVKRLIQRLNRLLKQRNEFTHRLFSASLPIEKVNLLAIKGALLGEVIFGKMLQLEKKINEKEDNYFSKIKKLKKPSEKERILSQIWVGKVK